MTHWQRNKAWKRFRLGRHTGVRGKPKKRILIVCEGEKTEPNYFRSFRVTSAVIRVEGLGKDTKRLIKAAINFKNDAIQKGESYDQVWCVFDRDSFDKNNFNEALNLAKDNAIDVAYSNEAFEVWYLLHFSYFHTGVPRTVYVNKLTKCLGKEYKKNSKTLYDDLLNKQGCAISNARHLFSSYINHDPEKDNPSTTVFMLVEELNKNI